MNKLLSTAMLSMTILTWPASTNAETDLHFAIRAVSTPSENETVTALPSSMATVVVGVPYYLELWVSDVGTNNTGVTSAYVDVPFDAAKVEILSIDHGTVFTTFSQGTIGSGRIDELGGSTLLGNIAVEPNWVRVATIQVKHKVAEQTTYGMAASATGCAAYNRGLIPLSNIDLSDSVRVTATPAVTLTYPNGGESFAGGREVSITWTSEAVAGTAATLSLSLDGGASWLSPSIAEVPVADGQYLWTLPKVDTTQAQIRIQTDAGYEDVSDASFTIDSALPGITSHTPSGQVNTPVDHVDITFTEPIQETSFTADDITMTAPGGPITVGAPQYQSGNVWRISFPAQSDEGQYTISIGPNIEDLAGNPMPEPYQGSFSIPVPPVIVDIPDASVPDQVAYAGPTPMLSQGTLPVTWSLIEKPAGMTINTLTGVVSWVSPTVIGSPHTVTIRAANLAGGDDESWQLTVTPRPPVIAEIGDAIYIEAQPYTGPTPALVQGTTPVTWTLVAGPADMTIDTSTGVVSWANPTTAGSPYTTTIRATNTAGSDDESWQLTAMVIPVIADIPDAIIAEGSNYVGPRPTLMQGNAVTWSLAEGPSGMTINSSTGVVSWANVTMVGSPHAVTIRASNTLGHADKTWHLSVQLPPVIDDIPDASVPERQPYTGPTPTLLQGVLPVTWSLVSGPSGMTIDSTTGVVSWPSPTSSATPYTVAIQAASPAGSDLEGWTLTVPPSYTATVTANVDMAPTGTPVVFQGQATWLDSGQPAPHVPVTIRLRVQGTRRVLSVTSDSSGQIATVWYPLPTEAGQYAVGADHPAVSTDPTQDQFILVGMRSEPTTVTHDIVPGASVTGQVELRNLGDYPLSGISATIQGSHPDVNIVVNAPPELASLGSAPLSYTIQSTGSTALQGTVPVNLSSAEGASATFTLSITIKPPTPRLEARPSSLSCGMLRGTQTLVQFEVSNTGGAATEALTVQIPTEPWLSLVSPGTMPPLAPGQTAAVVLRLAPATDLTLGPYNGTVIVAGTNANVTLPFQFNAISNGVGDVRVVAVDEYTYWAEGAPKVANATVTLKDAVTGALAASGVTNSLGELLIENVTEAHYSLEVRAGAHGNYRQTVLVAADQLLEVTAFLPRQLVSYVWTVQPTQIEDHYVFNIESVFETNVPVPVITVEPALIDLNLLTGESMQIDLTITNHGLIAAQGVKLEFGSHPKYRITALAGEVGELAAQTSITVPVTISNTEVAGYEQSASRQRSAEATLSGDDCTVEITAGVAYYLLCGPDNRWYFVPIYFTYPVVYCPGSSPTGGLSPIPPSEASPVGLSSGNPYVSNPTFDLATPSSCDFGGLLNEGPIIGLPAGPTGAIRIGPHPDGCSGATMIIHGICDAIGFGDRNHWTEGIAQAEASGTSPSCVDGWDWSQQANTGVCPLLQNLWVLLPPLGQQSIPIGLIELYRAYVNAQFVGQALGNWYIEKITAGELTPSDIHLIAHSMGGVAEAIAANMIYEKFHVPIAELVLIDTPQNPFGLPLPATSHINPESVSHVINIYGDRSLVAVGGPIPAHPHVTNVAADLAGRRPFEKTGHEKLADVCSEQVPDQPGKSWLDVVRDLPPGDWHEHYDASTRTSVFHQGPPSYVYGSYLNPVAEGSSVLLEKVSDWTGTNAVLSSIYGRPAVRLSEQDQSVSDGYKGNKLLSSDTSPQISAQMYRSIAIPEGTDYMQFEYSVDGPADGDELVISFNDRLLYRRSLYATTEAFVLSDLLFVTEFAGTTGQLVISLNSVGETGTSVYLSNLRLCDAGQPGSGGEEAEGICARVRIRIEQEAVITRSAFRATLEIDNNDLDMPVEAVSVTLDIRDEARMPANDRFGIYPPELTGISDVSGGGSVPPDSSAKAGWLIVPNSDAAPDQSRKYFVGGELSYSQNGIRVTVPLFPEEILVMPDASLQVKYFQQRDVYSDDPFTPEVEPAEPFSLGLLMTNAGHGTAKNVRITSAQPEIIDNEKGLLIDFKIIGTQIGTKSVSPSLTVNLGNIPPASTAVAKWLMTSSLQGKFIEYQATFEHLDGLGDNRLSLIDSVEIHELIHAVLVDDPADDEKPDFLVSDDSDLDHMPDTLYNSDGTTAVVNLGQNTTVDGPVTTGDLQVHLESVVPSGWVYIRTDDPGLEQFRLVKVVRSDGREIRVGDNAWTTHRTIRPAPREHLLHLVDHNSTGSYTLTYLQMPGALVSGDLDADGDVDGFDFLTFANCYNSSNRAPQAACQNPKADLDDDGDVDGFDFLTFSNCYNGSDRTPHCVESRRIGDLDADSDVDGFDFLTFANCYNGSDKLPLAACQNPRADIEGDGDVDGFDFLTFANCYNGSDRAPLCP